MESTPASAARVASFPLTAPSLARDDRGAHLLEYVLLVGFVALVALVGLKKLSHSVSTKTSAQADRVQSLEGVEGGDFDAEAAASRSVGARLAAGGATPAPSGPPSSGAVVGHATSGTAVLLAAVTALTAAPHAEPGPVAADGPAPPPPADDPAAAARRAKDKELLADAAEALAAVDRIAKLWPELAGAEPKGNPRLNAEDVGHIASSASSNFVVKKIIEGKMTKSLAASGVTVPADARDFPKDGSKRFIDRDDNGGKKRKLDRAKLEALTADTEVVQTFVDAVFKEAGLTRPAKPDGLSVNDWKQVKLLVGYLQMRGSLDDLRAVAAILDAKSRIQSQLGTAAQRLGNMFSSGVRGK